jgi:hypothetical protein
MSLYESNVPSFGLTLERDYRKDEEDGFQSSYTRLE